ncbi:uncharacterized protein PV09_02246 [Verruconis gallopava]|uniref:SH3 domain-containing protein n=1 Tax=Verruconis gallopava TaxID=253628 RepID=A0A0D2AKQ0_9PEZI|nr:uncharacterized protein PV09_02246 [Verruconis gallopava]KIW07403.1 hypothetical protein PV09_02246 [Verruconis gallopava]
MDFRSKPAEKAVPSGFPQGRLLHALPATATHSYKARDSLELTLTRNQSLRILEAKGDWWYIARTTAGDEGWVPSSYIKLLATPQSLETHTFYLAWSQSVAEAILGGSKSSKGHRLDACSFPWLPPEICTCEEPSCRLRKQEQRPGACAHDVESLMKGVGGTRYGAGWLWRQSLMWHPDRFIKKFSDEFVVDGMRAVAEMFTILTELSLQERERERKEKEKVELGI